MDFRKSTGYIFYVAGKVIRGFALEWRVSLTSKGAWQKLKVNITNEVNVEKVLPRFHLWVLYLNHMF